MKVVNYAAYTSVPWRVAALRPAHREYLATLHADGRLVACGPLSAWEIIKANPVLLPSTR
jgi:uncharacterized protein YciI